MKDIFLYFFFGENKKKAPTHVETNSLTFENPLVV